MFITVITKKYLEHIEWSKRFTFSTFDSVSTF